MPIAKFKCVREVSSEDSNFAAENLLKEDPGKKWKTKNAGEKSAYAILEFDRQVQITGIDIGNEHSAFVEVLVSSSGCRPEDFTEILITCSFMTPIESKNSTNLNRVRCFNKDALVATAAAEKWNLLKILCTQPFNKHIQYGLSFIKVHIADVEVSKKNLTPKLLVPESFSNQKETTLTANDTQVDERNVANKTKIFAKFALREESPDSDSESSAALFNRWKKSREDEKLPTTATAIRQAASTTSGLRKSIEGIKKVLPNAKNTSVGENKRSEVRDRNRMDLSFGAEEETTEKDKKLQRLSQHIEAEKKQLQAQSEQLKKKENKIEKSEKTPKTHIDTKPKEKQSSATRSITPNSTKKRCSSPSGEPSKKFKAENSVKYRPFNRLLEGVVLVISGIQNPDRANLRGKALAMGAKYKADWETGCTHLICAFRNTPKYNQVKGKGKIVKRSWIEKCFDLKKYLPWRRYALDSDEEAKPESDTEILDEALRPTNIEEDMDRKSRSSIESFEDKPFVLDSGSDTDDDIQRVMQKNKENKVPPKDRDIYDVTTEEEDFTQKKTKDVKTPLKFFEKLKFSIDNDITQGKKNQLERCINHYGGSVTEKSSEANFYVAETIPQICTPGEFKGIFVRPQWLFECNDMERKLPVESYVIAKD